MGVMGVILVGFAMFVAYLYSQGKIQAVWEAAFGTPSTDATQAAANPAGAGTSVVAVAPNAVAAATQQQATDNTGPLALPLSVIPGSTAPLTPTTFSNSSLSFPQVSVN